EKRRRVRIVGIVNNRKAIRKSQDFSPLRRWNNRFQALSNFIHRHPKGGSNCCGCECIEDVMSTVKREADLRFLASN
ncbi:MAG: hypothetical protein ABI415_09665, partial [Flavitalea sp.]